MRKKLLFILFIQVFIPIIGFGQTGVRISKPRLSLVENNIIINYDILSNNRSEKFRIWMEVTDSSGNKIIPLSYTGDLGENISGGNNKTIKWDYKADNMLLETGIFVQLFAEASTLPVTKEELKPEKSFNRTTAILQSAAFPGWGLSRISGNKLHFLEGVAGYGCIAASVVCNRKAYSSYNNYLASEDAKDLDDLYNTSVKQDNLSRIFAYSAIGIWVADIIWTMASKPERKRGGLTGQEGRIMIYPDYKPGINASALTIRLDF